MNPQEDIDFAPELPVAFDDDGNPVAVTHPVYHSEEEPEARTDAQETIAAFLDRLCEMDALDAGRTVILLGYLAGKTEAKTQHELAEKLNMTPGRVSQLLKGISLDFPSLARLKLKIRPIGRERQTTYDRYNR